MRGPWVTSGYYNNPEGAAQFTEDGWFRTGDVASLDPDGYIQITDRTKDLIKSGGEWISSVDMETTIMGHPKVLEAAVIAVPHPTWVERPLACVVPKPEFAGQLTAEEIMDYLTPARGQVVAARSTSSSSTRCPRPAWASSTRRSCASASRTWKPKGVDGLSSGCRRSRRSNGVSRQARNCRTVDARRTGARIRAPALAAALQIAFRSCHCWSVRTGSGPGGPGRERAEGGDPIARARVGRQIAQRAPAGAHSLASSSKKPIIPSGVDAGGEEQLHPVQVRLLLGTPAVLQLAEHPRALEPVGERPRHVAGQRHQQEPGRRVLDHRARGVPVQDVLDLVGEDPRQLLGRARPLEQPAEDHDVAARRGERIDVTGRSTTRTRNV